MTSTTGLHVVNALRWRRFKLTITRRPENIKKLKNWHENQLNRSQDEKFPCRSQEKSCQMFEKRQVVHFLARKTSFPLSEKWSLSRARRRGRKFTQFFMTHRIHQAVFCCHHPSKAWLITFQILFFLITAHHLRNSGVGSESKGRFTQERTSADSGGPSSHRASRERLWCRWKCKSLSYRLDWLQLN